LNVADHDISLKLDQVFCCLFVRKLAAKQSKHSQCKAKKGWFFLNIFVWGITPDYSTNGGRVIDTMYLEEKGKK